jgi:hypothetical protein
MPSKQSTEAEQFVATYQTARAKALHTVRRETGCSPETAEDALSTAAVEFWAQLDKRGAPTPSLFVRRVVDRAHDARGRADARRFDLVGASADLEAIEEQEHAHDHAGVPREHKRDLWDPARADWAPVTLTKYGPDGRELSSERLDAREFKRRTSKPAPLPLAKASRRLSKQSRSIGISMTATMLPARSRSGQRRSGSLAPSSGAIPLPSTDSRAHRANQKEPTAA